MSFFLLIIKVVVVTYNEEGENIALVDIANQTFVPTNEKKFAFVPPPVCVDGIYLRVHEYGQVKLCSDP